MPPSQPGSLDDIMKMLQEMAAQQQMQSQAAGAKSVEALQRAAAEPQARQGYRAKGQTGLGSLLRPNQNQARAMMAAGAGMMSGQRGEAPGRGFSRGINSGFDLLSKLREQQRNARVEGHNNEAKVQDYQAKMAQQNANNSLGWYDRFQRQQPKPTAPPSSQREKIEYLDAEGNVTGLGYASYVPGKGRPGTWHDQEGPLQKGTFRPLVTGRTESDTASRQKTTSEDVRFLAGMAAAHDSVKTMQGMLGESPTAGDVFSNTAQGAIRLTPVGRKWYDAANTATEFVARALSGTAVKTEERGEIRAMIVPSIEDSLNPEVARLKLARFEAFTKYTSRHKAGDITAMELILHLESVTSGANDVAPSDSQGGGASTPGGMQHKSPGGVSFTVKQVGG